MALRTWVRFATWFLNFLTHVAHPSNQAHSYMNTITLKGSMIIFTQSNMESLFTGEIIRSKFIKSQNRFMALCRHKVTKQGKMCGVLTRLIENGAFYTIFTRYENFASTNWYHKATAPISTVIFTLSQIIWRNVMELIKN